MSVLYRAKDESLDRVVAIKVISAELTEDESFRRRFSEEARLAASVDRPNVVPIYAFGEEDGKLYIAMRLIPGVDLRQLIAADHPMTLERIGDLLGQIAAALDRVHAAGMVHRDVKPDNILVSPSAPPTTREHAYLSDFGLTRSDTRSRLTQAGQIVGTLAYASPEQLQDEPVTSASDIYSLGCVLFEMITGLRPFPRSSDGAVIYAHLQDPPPPIASLRSGVPEAVDQVVARAMVKDPALRFASAADLCLAFGQAMAAGSGVETQMTVPGLVKLPPAPNPSSGMAATSSPPKIVDAPTVIRAASPPAPADRPRRKPRSFVLGLLVVVLLAGLVGAGFAVRSRTNDGEIIGKGGGGTTPTAVGVKLVVQGAAVPVNASPPVTLQTRLIAENDGAKLGVELIFRNLSNDWVHINWPSQPPEAIAEIGIEVAAPDRCGMGSGASCVDMLSEFDQGPKSESRRRYTATLITPVTTAEALNVWLAPIARVGGSGEITSQVPMSTIAPLPVTGTFRGTVTRCTQVGTDGPDEIVVARNSEVETVCGLGGDDTIIMPPLSMSAAGPDGDGDGSPNGSPNDPGLPGVGGSADPFGQSLFAPACITVHGGAGNDLLSFETTTATGFEAAFERGSAASRTADGSSAFLLSSSCNPAAPALVSFDQIERLRGSARNDILSSHPGVTPEVDVELDGYLGDDQLSGSTLAGVLDGGEGNDQCYSDRDATIRNCEDSGRTPPFLPPAPPNQ